MPSEMESFGLAALEAMACGVPPVATRVGGLPELVTDGVDGYLEPVGDIPAQASRVIELLTNEKLHQEWPPPRARPPPSGSPAPRSSPIRAYYEEIVANSRP